MAKLSQNRNLLEQKKKWAGMSLVRVEVARNINNVMDKIECY
jgi:hypothetical protein